MNLKHYGPENDRKYRYGLEVIDNFSKIGCKVPLKNKNAQTIKDTFESFFISSKRKSGLIVSDRGE